MAVRPATSRVERTGIDSWYSGHLAPADDLAPDPALKLRHEGAGLSLEQHSSLRQDGHRGQRSLTSSTMCVERITTDVLADLASRLWKRLRSSGIEAGGRLVDDDQLRIAEQRLRDAEALAHAAGERAELALAHVPEIGHAAAAPRTTSRRSRRCDVPSAPRNGPAAPRPRCPGRRRTPAAGSRGAAQRLVVPAKHVEVVEADAAASASCSVAMVRISVDLPGSVGPEQAEHAAGDLQTHVLQGVHAVVVGLGDVFDSQHLSSALEFPGFLGVPRVPRRSPEELRGTEALRGTT